MSYSTQVISEGNFFSAPTIAEEMYNSDIFGKSKKEEIKVAK